MADRYKIDAAALHPSSALAIVVASADYVGTGRDDNTEGEEGLGHQDAARAQNDIGSQVGLGALGVLADLDFEMGLIPHFLALETSQDLDHCRTLALQNVPHVLPSRQYHQYLWHRRGFEG